MNDVATVIVTHNAQDGIYACIASVRAASEGVSNEIIVVDADSSDGTVAVAQAAGGRVVQAENLGYGAGNNLGWRSARPARYLLILNPDATISHGKLGGLIAFADEHPDAGIFAPKLVDDVGAPVQSLGSFAGPWRELAHRIVGRPLDTRYTPVRDFQGFEWAVGCALLFRAACFDEVCGFDERFFHSCEELDLQRSSRQAGWRHLTYPELVVVHTYGERQPDARVFAQLMRGRLYEAQKSAGPGGVVAVRIGLALDMLRRLYRGNPGEWAPAYRAALRTLLTERVYRDPVCARTDQRRRMLGEPAGANVRYGLRVLLICQEFPGFGVSGGIGTYAGVIARELAERGVELHVLCVSTGLTRGTHRGPGYVVHTGPYRQLRGIGRPLGLPRAALWVSQAYSVWREYRRLGLKFDVIEAPELYAESAAIALLERRIPLVVRLHSGFAFLAVPPDDRGRDFRATVAVENFAVRHADLVVSTAPYLDAATRNLKLDPKRTRAIIYPVPEAQPVPMNNSRVVLFVGRLERRKGPELLIDAAPHVLRAIPEARFRFVGMDTQDAAGRSYLELLTGRARELGVEGAIEFVGPVPHDQVQVEMGNAQVCAFPSTAESFGLVVADAGAIGRPVVVSDIPAFSDFVSDGVSGWMVKRPEGQAWAEVLIAALSDSTRASEMAGQLRSYLRERASPTVVVDQVLESYATAISTRTARRG